MKPSVCKVGKSLTGTVVSLDVVNEDEAIRNPLCASGTTDLETVKNR